jgi:signal transduction histidine kinase/CheY-like chemotaxis protein
VVRAAAAADRAADAPAGPSRERRRLAAAAFSSVAALAVLAAFAGAALYPDFSPAIAAGVVFLGGVALWGAARVDHRRLAPQRERHAAEKNRHAPRLENLADTPREQRESEERYRSLIDAQGDLVVRRDASGKVTFANPAFVRAFKRAAAPMLGDSLPLVPLVAPGAPDHVVARDVKLVTQAGWRWFSWADVRMRDEIYSVARDLTARKESEQALVDARQKAEAASQAKSRVLATVSHEFRTPLNGILGLAGLLGETPLSPDQATYAHAIRSSGEALLALVDDMLDFSRIEAGRLDLRPEPTDIEALLQEIAELLAGRAHVKDIDIAVEVSPDLPASVLVDPARLRQVLINLAGNGVKFTEAGGVALSARAVPDGIAFAVADSGPGIPDGDGERLFDEFEQMDTALSRRHGGAGLGLAISRRIVRQMGGDIALARREGGGSVFAFTLALPVVEAAPAASLAAAPLDGRSILILAPEGAEPPAVARHLRDAGAAVRVARTLAEAAGLAGAAAAAGEMHDALLIDARVAPSPGVVLMRLREAAGHRIPAAVLIAPGGRGAVDELRGAGFDAYLVRPVRRASLIRVAAARGRKEGFPAILMDLHMPGLDGLAAARAIREWEYATGAPRAAILAITADVLPETRSAAEAAGIDALLAKPMTPDSLRRALARLTGGPA